MSDIIPLFRPSITDREISAVTEVLKSGWLGLGSKTEEFEKKFAKFTGAKFAIGVNSCTSALDLSLKAHDIKDGEVIVPALTFVSTALVGLYNNCKIVFADIDEETLCMDWEDALSKVTKNTKAILPVWYGGKKPEIPGYPKGIIKIDDCAHACGSKDAGSIVTSCFSFHAVKNITSGGDGGMITTNDEEIYKKLLPLRWLGIDKSTYERTEGRYGWQYNISTIGQKAHMNDVSASIGLVQLERLEEMNNKRKLRVLQYLYELKDLNWLRLSKYDNDSSWHLFTIRVDKKIRNSFIDYLLAKGISAGVHYFPLNKYSIFPNTRLPITDEVWQQLVTLPLYCDLSNEDFDRIIKAIKNYKS